MIFSIGFSIIVILLSSTVNVNGQATLFTSNYASELTINSEKYLRNGNSLPFHYYQTILLNVNKAGVYRFTSESTMNTYGYIYQDIFYPSYPSFNILAEDDDSAGNGQFKIYVSLQNDRTYSLVVTTFSGETTGPFSIKVDGPENVNLIPIYNS